MHRIINTLENYFSTIVLVGSNESIEKYLEKSDKIAFVKYNKEINAESDRYIIDTNDFSVWDSVIVFDEKYHARKTYTKDGKELFSVFLKKSEDTNCSYSLTGCNADIDNVIVPTLKKNGVSVIKCYSPDEKRIYCRNKLKNQTRIWRVIRKISTPLFNELRHRLRGTNYLKHDQKSLTNDMSRGYSIMYGNGKYINFEDGFRRTINDVDSPKIGDLYIFGPCFVRGLAQEDKKTIASILQERIPSYRVHNMGSEFNSINLVMRLPKYKKNDVVVFFDIDTFTDRDSEKYDFYYDMTHTWNSIPHLWKHVYDDAMHYDNTVHYKLIDDLEIEIRKALNTDISQNDYKYKGFGFGSSIKKAPNILDFDSDDDLATWAEKVLSANPYSGENRGAIVMNCNPFTLGHRYLIENSAKKVDKLFVFVLQENKSFFSFEDRIDLVKKGTSDLENVIVVPSGRHIISAQTLPGYFNKKELSDTVVDLGLDLDLFARIAETLHISTRFAGKEPLDPFTDRYNKKMGSFLPLYGIKFVEIERLSSDGQVISASRVRKCLECGNLDEIRHLVPETTYAYLEERQKNG